MIKKRIYFLVFLIASMLPFHALHAQRFKEDSAPFVEKLLQYQQQASNAPLTAIGYQLFAKLNSEFLELTSDVNYRRAMISDDALLNLSNKVADIFIKRRAEFGSVEKQVKREKDAEAEKSRMQIVRKYELQIARLGFASNFLESTIYLQEPNQELRKFMKFKEWLAILFDTGKYMSIQRATVKKMEGVLLKTEGKPSTGVIFRKDANELFASYFLNSPTQAIELDANDQGVVSVYILKSIAE